MNGSESAPRTETSRSGRKRAIRLIAVQASLLSAAAHVLWAWPRLSTSGDPRPYVFILAATFTLAIAVATFRGGEYRRLYALGAGTLASFLVGFVLWHRSAPIEAFVADPYAIVGTLAEILGVLTFAALYRLAPPTRVAVERRREENKMKEKR
ncbi:hypothetical protein ACERIT_04620 [Halopenitus sp. H-Gu1]|uniref:hypothetical protein n=1 Tax=Halopenitus sp. H-Gu1 TaxID=3242697 RepID=UPI00359D196E